MIAETFWAVRSELYERPSADPTYYCSACGHELAGDHEPRCPVSWFERRFFRPEFNQERSTECP